MCTHRAPSRFTKSEIVADAPLPATFFLSCNVVLLSHTSLRSHQAAQGRFEFRGEKLVLELALQGDYRTKDTTKAAKSVGQRMPKPTQD